MNKRKVARSEASDALVALRTAMGLTQQRFAVEVVRTAITTIARWETSNPPKGEVLLHLASVAEKEVSRLNTDPAGTVDQKLALLTLRDVFTELHLRETVENLNFHLAEFPPTKTNPVVHGYLLEALEGPEEIRAAKAFMLLKAGLRSGDSKARKAAAALEKAAAGYGYAQ